MPIPLDLTVRDMDNTDAIRSKIEQKTQKLETFYDHIEYCKVVVDIPQKHKHQGKLYNIHLELAVPGKKLIANQHPNEDLYVAIRDTYAALTRQLEEYTRRQRGEVKFHPEALLFGKVLQIFPEAGYGFIKSADEREFFFQRGNMVSAELANLSIGSHVSFMETVGGDGLQADHVTVVNRQKTQG